MYEQPAGDPLARQSRLGLLIQDVLTRYGTHCPSQVSRSGRADMERVRNYLEEGFDTQVRLADLAALIGMNPFRLVRCFTQTWGLPRIDMLLIKNRSSLPSS